MPSVSLHLSRHIPYGVFVCISMSHTKGRETMRRHKLLIMMILLTIGAAVVALLTPYMNSRAASIWRHSAPNVTSGDWPTYMFSNIHQGNNPYETQLNTSNVP